MDLEEFKKRNELLEHARIQLKKEFIALDQVIDEMIDLSRSWFLLNHLQTKPAQIFLTGMTGCGKSALVQRFVELIFFDKKTYFFDCGEITKANSLVEDTLINVFEKETFPAIFVLDEFNKARSIDENGSEKNEPSMRIVWRLLDDGRPVIRPYRVYLDTIWELAMNLKYLISRGITAEKGAVVNGKELYLKLMNEEKCDDYHYTLVTSYDIGKIHTIVEAEYETEFQLQKHLLTLNHIETLSFLTEAYKKGIQPAEVDCSKSLVFVLANLDEAYTMSSNVDPDMDADAFCKASKKIGIPQVKTALHKRFTSEQIARLGNNMILYPAFSKENFEELIELKLSVINKNLLEKTSFSITFDKAFKQMIYGEGVYPAQGTRPLFSTISALVENNIPKAIFESYEREITNGKFQFAYRRGQIAISVNNEKLLVFKPVLKLKELRKNKKDEGQAIVAVHEAGHAVLSACVNRIAPKELRSVTANNGQSGYTYIEGINSFQTLQLLKNQIIILQGGIAAERLIYGNDQVTFGSQNDLSRATAIAKSIVVEYGMLTKKGVYSVFEIDTQDSLKADDHTLNQAELLLDEAYNEAIRILKLEKVFLLETAKYLSQKTSMNQKTFKTLAHKYCVDSELKKHGFLNKEGDFFRLKLKMELRKSSEKKSPNIEVNTNDLILNKDAN